MKFVLLLCACAVVASAVDQTSLKLLKLLEQKHQLRSNPGEQSSLKKRSEAQLGKRLWLGSLIDSVEHVVEQAVDGVVHAVGDVEHAVEQAVGDVVHAVGDVAHAVQTAPFDPLQAVHDVGHVVQDAGHAVGDLVG